MSSLLSLYSIRKTSQLVYSTRFWEILLNFSCWTASTDNFFCLDPRLQFFFAAVIAGKSVAMDVLRFRPLPVTTCSSSWENSFNLGAHAFEHAEPAFKLAWRPLIVASRFAVVRKAAPPGKSAPSGSLSSETSSGGRGLVYRSCWSTFLIFQRGCEESVCAKKHSTLFL